MSKKNKKPRWVSSPSYQKEPRFDERNSPSESQRISWHIKRLDQYGPYGWSEVAKETLWAQILRKLAEFETMAWSEIEGKTGSHPVPIMDLCPEAQRRLREIKQDDVESLFSLRFGGKPRIWGIRNRNILSILWWDPDHKVYPAPKKHT